VTNTREERDRLLRDELEFYADPANWNGFSHPDNPCRRDMLQVVEQKVGTAPSKLSAGILPRLNQGMVWLKRKTPR
jgi:hypothetical protein